MDDAQIGLLLGAISGLERGVVFFLGQSDTGKSTLIARLGNELVKKGTLAILDGDIGQSSIVPLTITLLRAVSPFESFADLERVRQEFIPGFNLILNRERNASAMGEMAREARRWARYCLVDTTGFVQGPGVLLKKAEIKEVDPDLVAALQVADELVPVLEGVDRPVVMVPIHPEVLPKPELERRRRRYARLNAYFKNASLRRVPLVAARERPLEMEDRLVGVYGDRFLGLGAVDRVEGSTLLVLTPVGGKIKDVEFTPVIFRPGMTE